MPGEFSNSFGRGVNRTVEVEPRRRHSPIKLQGSHGPKKGQHNATPIWIIIRTAPRRRSGSQTETWKSIDGYRIAFYSRPRTAPTTAATCHAVKAPKMPDALLWHGTFSEVYHVHRHWEDCFVLLVKSLTVFGPMIIRAHRGYLPPTISC